MCVWKDCTSASVSDGEGDAYGWKEAITVLWDG